MNLRDLVLEHQRNLTSCGWDAHRTAWARAWAAGEGQPLAMRWAAVGAARLADLDFLHTAEEPLIGRITAKPHTKEEEREAEEYLKKNELWTPGQTGHAEPFYDDLFALGFDGLRAKAAPMPSMVVAIDGIAAMIEHAAEAAATEEVASLCRRVAHRPPETDRKSVV